MLVCLLVAIQLIVVKGSSPKWSTTLRVMLTLACLLAHADLSVEFNVFCWLNPLESRGNYTATWNNMKLGCYIWYSKEGPWRGPRPLLAVPNVTAHPSTASVPITVSEYNGPLLCGFNMGIKGLTTDWCILFLGVWRLFFFQEIVSFVRASGMHVLSVCVSWR